MKYNNWWETVINWLRVCSEIAAFNAKILHLYTIATYYCTYAIHILKFFCCAVASPINVISSDGTTFGSERPDIRPFSDIWLRARARGTSGPVWPDIKTGFHVGNSRLKSPKLSIFDNFRLTFISFMRIKH